jgi:hypothetical protein
LRRDRRCDEQQQRGERREKSHNAHPRSERRGRRPPRRRDCRVAVGIEKMS